MLNTTYTIRRIDEIVKTEELIQAIEEQRFFETPDELKHSVEILLEVELLFVGWVKELSIARSLTQTIVPSHLGGKIFTYGSYSLGVHHKDAEIDALCVAKRCVGVTDFYGTFFQLLRRRPQVTKCSIVDLRAYDPVIKVEYNGVSINLSFIRVSLKEIPEDLDLRRPNVELNWYIGSKHSLSCCRATDEVLALVPHQETFHLVLRTIILWAKRNGLYSSVLGYFDALTWAILVARVCQLYPNAPASTVVQKFFWVFLVWQWPLPVLLENTHGIGLRINNLMPVITPLSPQQNLTACMFHSSKSIILAELKRAMLTTDDIMADRFSWQRLFMVPNFLTRYKNYIMILVSSQYIADHLEWCDLAESKMRVLVNRLEHSQHITLAHINPNRFTYKKGYSPADVQWLKNAPLLFTYPFSSIWYIGLEFRFGSEDLPIPLTGDIDYYTELVLLNGRGRLSDETNIEALHIKI